MDTSEIRAAVGHLQNDHDDDRPDKTRTNFPSRIYSVQSKVIEDLDNGSLSKREVQTTRPCAIIGPDRILPQQPKQGIYNPPPAHLETWMQSHHEVSYHKPVAHQRPTEHSYPPRNISPRQTFQENMPRILVPPRSDVIKMTHDHVGASSYPYQGTIYSAKVLKPNGPQVSVPPYVMNQMQRERRVCEQKSDIYIPKCDVTPDVVTVHNKSNIEERGWQQVPIPPYQGVNYPLDHRYSEYQSCLPVYRPLKPYKKIAHENPPQALVNEAYYRTERYEPYPAPKEKYMRTRYEYQPNSSPHIQYPTYPAKYEFNKSVIQGQMPVPYQQVPHHRVVEVNPDCVHKMPVPRHTPNFNVPYNSENINIKQGPHESFPHQSKVYGYGVDINHRHIPKGAYENSKRFVEYNSRVRNIPYPDNHFPPDQIYTNCHKGQVPYYNLPPTNVARVPNYSVNYHRMFDGHTRPYPEYNVPCKYPDMRQNMFNPLARIPTEFSPNIISPTDSNTSVESIPPHMIQEDCGYVSQCSTTSNKSADFQFSRLHSYEQSLNKMSDPRHFMNSLHYKPPLNQSVQEYGHSTSDNTCSIKENAKSKKHIDVRQFLQTWDEDFEDECSPSGKTNNNNISKETMNVTKFQNNSQNSDQLYVLGLVNVSSEELKKYEHIQKVTKLPDNIKGYDNIELLNQFDEVFGSSQQPNPSFPSVIFPNEHKKQNTVIEPHLQPLRPPSPLDVEAKISQSVIHKEVGCNFEIKPCSPHRLNVNMDTIIPTAFHDGQNAIIYDSELSCSERVAVSLPDSNSTELRILGNCDQEKKLILKRKEKRKIKSLDTEIATKQIKISNDDNSGINHVDGNLVPDCVSEQYVYNNATPKAPCYSSLPQLDTDIDAGLCKEGEENSLKTYNVLQQCQLGPVSQDKVVSLNSQFLSHCSDFSNNDSGFEQAISTSRSEASPIAEDIQNLSNTDDKSGNKLSKYRKIRVKDYEFNAKDKSVIKNSTNFTVQTYETSLISENGNNHHLNSIVNDLHDKSLPVLTETQTTKSTELIIQHEDLTETSKEYDTTIIAPASIDSFNINQQITDIKAKTDTTSTHVKIAPSICTDSVEISDTNPWNSIEYGPNDVPKNQVGMQHTYSSMDVHHGFKNLIMKRMGNENDKESCFHNNANGSNGLNITINNGVNKNMDELIPNVMNDEQSELRVKDNYDSKMNLALDLTKPSVICNGQESENKILDNEFNLETINNKIMLNKVLFEKEQHFITSNASESKESYQELNDNNNAISHSDEKVHEVNVDIKAHKKFTDNIPSVIKLIPNDCNSTFIENDMNVFQSGEEKSVSNFNIDKSKYLSKRYNCLYSLTKRHLHLLLTQPTEKVLVEKLSPDEVSIKKTSPIVTDISPAGKLSPAMMDTGEQSPTSAMSSKLVLKKTGKNISNPVPVKSMNEVQKEQNVTEISESIIASISKVIDNKSTFDGVKEVLSKEKTKLNQTPICNSNLCILDKIENSGHGKTDMNKADHIDNGIKACNNFSHSMELECVRKVILEDISTENCLTTKHNQNKMDHVNNCMDTDNSLANSIVVDDKMLNDLTMDLPEKKNQRDASCHLKESMDKIYNQGLCNVPENGIDYVGTAHLVNVNKSEISIEKTMLADINKEMVQESNEHIYCRKESQELNKEILSAVDDRIMDNEGGVLKKPPSTGSQSSSDINIQSNTDVSYITNDIVQVNSSKSSMIVGNTAANNDINMQDNDISCRKDIEKSTKVTLSIIDTTEYSPKNGDSSREDEEIISCQKWNLTGGTGNVGKVKSIVCAQECIYPNVENSDKSNECHDMKTETPGKMQEQESYVDILNDTSNSKNQIERCLNEDNYSATNNETQSIECVSDSLNYNLSLPLNYSLICSTSLISPLSEENSTTMDSSCENQEGERAEFDSESDKINTENTEDIKKHEHKSFQSGIFLGDVPSINSTSSLLISNEDENEQIINTENLNMNDNLEEVNWIKSSMLSPEIIKTDSNCEIVDYGDESNLHKTVLLLSDCCKNAQSPSREECKSPIQTAGISSEESNVWPNSLMVSENDGKEHREDLNKNYYLSTNDVIKDLSTHSDNNTLGKESNNETQYFNHTLEFADGSGYDDKADTNDNYVIYNDSLVSEDVISENLDRSSVPSDPNYNNESVGDGEQYRSEGIAVKFDDCWIDDVACIETVVSEDVDSESLPQDNNIPPDNEDMDNNVLNRLSNIITEVNKKGLGNLNTSFYASDATNYADAQTIWRHNYFRENREISDLITLKSKFHNHINKDDDEKVSQTVRSHQIKMRTSDNMCFNEHKNGGRKLVTKAAQKYIPPLAMCDQNFKVHLPLPKSNLIHLKKLKLERTLRKEKPKARKKDSPVKMDAKAKSVIPKRIKPKFEDVLKNIDHVQMSLAKSKQKKCSSTKQCIPKMIIKKNENGAHYTSTTLGNNSFNPDLTGSKWQPWVCMEKSSFIDRMIRKNKFIAKYCRISNKYILPSQSSNKSKELQKKKTFTFLCNNIEVKNDLNSLKCTIKLNSKANKKSRKMSHSSHTSQTYQRLKCSSFISNYKS